MEISMIRMMANLIDIDKIEVQLSKNYYQGISPKFYLRDLNNGSLEELIIQETKENDKYVIYYFINVYINFIHNYQIVDNYGLGEQLQYEKLVNSNRFDDIFYYDGDDLGTNYSKERTEFKLWAPTALEVKVSVNHQAYPMTRGKNGVYHAFINGDLENQEYVYLVKLHNSFNETLDPYAYASNANGRANIIIDPKKISCDLNLDKLKPLNKKTDAVIYETSVRDFTMSGHVHFNHPGKFLGMIENGIKSNQGHKIGLDYLVDLGITHLQLMPIYDFATVDEIHPNIMYNWGYDPMQYGIPDGSFTANPNYGYSRVNECRAMVAGLHNHGIRVVMDVVYNHMYDVNASAFERTVPGYYFRKDDTGKLSNGSWCGNDLNTKAKMVRKYIKDICKRWQLMYGIDGFRFDLMGIIDIETLNQIYDQSSKIDDNFIMYGEGWNMGTALPDSEKGMQDNHASMLNIGFFNDFFRENIKGGSGDSVLGVQGYLAGNSSLIANASLSMTNTNRYSYVDQSINYLECHDNATMFDKLSVSNASEGIETRKKRQLMMNIALILAQGIPFIHSGQEFYRTKRGICNTYNRLDSINALDWQLLDENIADVEIIKKAIKLRKENEAFRYETIEDVNKYVEVSNINNEVLIYKTKQDTGKYCEFIIYFNPSYNIYEISNMENYEVIYNDNDSLTKLTGISMKVFGLKR